jgi:hypothetical protein
MVVLATPLIKWSAVGKILLAGLIGGAGVVVVFGFLLLGLSRARRAAGSPARLADYALSGVCGVLVLAAVVVGIYAMIHKPASSKPKATKAAAGLVAPERHRRLVA